MPKTDLTTTVVDGSKNVLRLIRSRVKQRIFAGPGVVQLSPKEALARFKAMTPEERIKMHQDLGPDAFMNYVESLMEGNPHAR